MILKGLSSNKDIILQNADKVNSFVLVNKSDYTKRIKELLSDVGKFKEIYVEPGKEISLLPQHEGKLIEFTCNIYIVNDSFDFAKDITEQSSKLLMASLVVDSLFTNVPLDKTIEICVTGLFKTSHRVSSLSKQQVLEILSLITKESII